MQRYAELSYNTMDEFISNSSKEGITDRILENYRKANDFNRATIEVIERDPSKAYIHGSEFFFSITDKDGGRHEVYTNVRKDSAIKEKEIDIRIINARIDEVERIKRVLEGKAFMSGPRKVFITKTELKETLGESNAYFNQMFKDLEYHVMDIPDYVTIE